jgi:hypothetical protein
MTAPDPKESPGSADDNNRPHYLLSQLPPDGSVERAPDPEDKIRKTLAIVLCGGFSLITVLIVIGGMVGKFDQTLVDGVVTAFAGSAVSVACFYFYRKRD